MKNSSFVRTTSHAHVRRTPSQAQRRLAASRQLARGLRLMEARQASEMLESRKPHPLRALLARILPDSVLR